MLSFKWFGHMSRRKTNAKIATTKPGAAVAGAAVKGTEKAKETRVDYDDESDEGADDAEEDSDVEPLGKPK